MVMGSLREDTEVAVIGGGPGGYVAAIRAADLGKEVLLVEERERLGGVCLLEGCIPSKALISAVELLNAARGARKLGISFGEPEVDLTALRRWMDSVVGGLSKGVAGLLKRRSVEVIRGRARFESNELLSIEGGEVAAVGFRHCIIATGSRVAKLPPAGDLPIWYSPEALKVSEIPERLIVVGGGYIGLELGLAYAGLGSKVAVLEAAPNLLEGADPDLAEVLRRRCDTCFEGIHVGTKVVGLEETAAGFAVTVEAQGETKRLECDRVLAAVGRTPNTDDLGLEKAGITTDDRGRIAVNEERRTGQSHIYAIGDVVPGPMLAHKASREGKVVAEVIAEHPSAFDNRAIPSVVFTDPEIAWVGLTEKEARERNVKVEVSRFPMRALGRAWTLGRTEGFAKILSDPDNGAVLGMSVAAPHASELISEGTLALEMGATLEDLTVTIHPHPTLSEALMESAEVAAGTPVHIPPAKGSKGS